MKKVTKKLTGLLLLVCCICLCAGNALAADTVQEVIQYDDGTYAEISLSVEDSITRASTKSASKIFTYKDPSGNVIFSYTLHAKFEYTGSSSKATSCSTAFSISKSGWSRKSESHYYSGNKAYGTAKFANSISSKTANLTITCSKTGVIS
ncbi:MAG: hypothetical protein LUE11_03185 [Clostridia bacterium]|nr:hypothetical protein [Clostridia bacterium]